MIQQDSKATHEPAPPEGLVTSRRINYYLQAVECGLFASAAHSDVPIEFQVEGFISYFVRPAFHLTVAGPSYKYTKLL